MNYLFPSEKCPSLTLSGPRTYQSASPIFILSVTANCYEKDHEGILSTLCDFVFCGVFFVVVVLCFLKEADF